MASSVILGNGRSKILSRTLSSFRSAVSGARRRSSETGGQDGDAVAGQHTAYAVHQRPLDPGHLLAESLPAQLAHPLDDRIHDTGDARLPDGEPAAIGVEGQGAG